MTSNDTKSVATRFQATDERIDMLEQDVLGLKAQFKTASSILPRLSQLQMDMSDQYADLNNKIASIRGMLASAERTKKQQQEGAPALPPYAMTPIDPKIEQMVNTGLLSKRQGDDMYRAKALIQTFDSMNMGGTAESSQEHISVKEEERPSISSRHPVTRDEQKKRVQALRNA
ncbi:MAG: hypothetical protein ACREBU_06850 [Nitrososphaera sp.]